MRFKAFFIIICIVSSLLANENVEILAKSVVKNGDIVHAKDEVVLYSQQYVMTADEAFYNTINGDLELLGNITILDGIDFSSRSGKAEINLNDSTGRMVPFFSYLAENDLWVKCGEGTFDANFYMTKDAITSSCEVQNPDWKMGFTTGKYSKEDKFMHLYNALFYVKDVPLFYLPYFSFSTDKTRRSGLLRPKYGLGKSEGLFYLQPIYLAPYQNWDLELSPQIRTQRGYGLHSTFRFVDSMYSKGQISLGQFNEYSDYAKENDLKNDTHRGYSLYYERDNLFSDLDEETTQDALLLDFQYLNDVDYLNTLDESEASYDNLITSKLNYFYSRQKDYFGLYAKYYIDTKKVSNETTLQEIPSLHYHKYLDTVFMDKIYYFIDYKSTNYTREEGSNAFQNEITLPISIHFPLFEDYIHFKFSESFYLTRVDYSHHSLRENYGQFSKNYHTFSLYTDLAKSYEDFFHTLYFGVNYILPGISKRKGYFENYIPINEDEESVNLDLVQYFYDNSGTKRVSHSVKQSFYYSDYKYKYGDLENTIKVYLDNGLSISNILNYSHQYAKTSKVQTSISWAFDEYDFSLTHTHENSLGIEKTNFLSLDISTDYLSNYNFFAGLDYDMHDDFFKSWKIGWKYDKKCWNYILTYREDKTPKLTSSGSDVVNKKGVYLMFTIAQIGAVNYDFVKESSNEISDE